MGNKDYYHFHRDCAYFEQCRIEEVKENGHKLIKFYCPAYSNHKDSLEGTYYKGDFDTIKWECAKFIPIQERLSLES